MCRIENSYCISPKPVTNKSFDGHIISMSIAVAFTKFVTRYYRFVFKDILCRTRCQLPKFIKYFLYVCDYSYLYFRYYLF